MFSRQSPKPEGGHVSQDAWSAAFPPDHDQPFDQHPFGRMDRPSTPLPDRVSHGPEHLGLPFRRPESVAASILNDEPCGLDHNFSPIRRGPTRNDDLLEPDHTTSLSRHENSCEISDFEKPARRQELYRAVPPGEITPYLGLRARLTQIPINRWTILLLLLVARMVILFNGLHANLSSAQEEASSACSKVEDIGSALASMPHYMSLGVNELVANGITDTVRGLINVLMMILTGVEEIIMWYISFTEGTFLCLFTVLIHGIVTLAGDAVGLAVDAVNELIKPVMDAVTGAVSGVEDVLRGIQAFTGNAGSDLSKITDGMDQLSNLQLDNSAIIGDILDLNNKIPNFTTLQTDIQFIIDMPFETIKLLLNESYGNWTMDPSILPVAEKESLTFCTGHDGLTTFFDVLFTIAVNAKIIVMIGLLILAMLAAVFMAWWEIKRYRKTVVRAQTLRDREPMDVVYVAGRPLTAGTGLWIAEKASRDPKRQMLIRWCIAYATTYTALFVLSLAVAGAFSVFCQFLVMRAIQKEAPGLAAEVGDFVSEVVGTLETASTRWSNESNAAIMSVQSDLNDKILIHVQNATSAINDSINYFENKTTWVLQEAFGETQLLPFVTGVVECIITDKLDKVQKGLDWVHEHAHVTFPEFPTNLFSLGLGDPSGGNTSLTGVLASSGSATANDITGAVNKVIAALQSSMIQEGLIALILLLVYIAYVCFAVAQATLRMFCMRDDETEQRRDSFADESKIPSGDDERQRRRTMGGESKLSRTPESLAPSRFSEFELSKVFCESEKPAVEVVRDPAAAELPPAQDEEGLQVGIRPRPEEYGDPFGDETYAVVEEQDGAGVVHALPDSRAALQSRRLTPQGAHFWTEDGAT